MFNLFKEGSPEVLLTWLTGPFDVDSSQSGISEVTAMGVLRTPAAMRLGPKGAAAVVSLRLGGRTDTTVRKVLTICYLLCDHQRNRRANIWLI